MNFEGIQGSVTSTGYEKWIELQSCSAGLSRAVSTTVGAAGERESGQPNFADIAITKEQDNSTGKLLKECVSSTRGKKVQIDFVNTDRNRFAPVMKIELVGVIITSQALAGHGDANHGPILENYSLSFTKVIFTPTTRNADGTAATNPERVGYDLATAKPF
jgi:type VI secretion system secreted protein Hcp